MFSNCPKLRKFFYEGTSDLSRALPNTFYNTDTSGIKITTRHDYNYNTFLGLPVTKMDKNNVVSGDATSHVYYHYDSVWCDSP